MPFRTTIDANGTANVLSDSGRSRPKRQRVSRACDSCRRKKIKCDGVRPTCTNCGNAKQQCIYTAPNRKPQRVPKKINNIVALQSRLEKIELLLEKIVPDDKRKHLSEDDSEDEDAAIDQDGENDNMSDGTEQQGQRGSSVSGEALIKATDGAPEDGWINEDENEDENVPGSGRTLLIDFEPTQNVLLRDADLVSISMARGYSQLYTSGTIFTLFTKSGLQWIKEKSGNPDVGGKIADIFKKIHRSHDQRVRHLIDLPAKPYPLDRKLMSLCLRVFREGPMVYQMILPLSEIEILFEAENNDQVTPNGYSELLILSALMALCCPMLILSDTVRDEVRMTHPQIMEYYRMYTTNCIYYSTRIRMLKPHVNSLRGLVLTMIAFQCSGIVEPNIHLTLQAGRLAVDLGLNRWEACQGVSNEEAEKRQGLFLAFYILDRDISLRMGRCPTILDFDISAKYPSSLVKEEGNPVILIAKLLKIAGKTYPLLFSAEASKKKPTDLVRAIYDLDKELMQWKEEVPVEWRPDGGLDYFEKMHREAKVPSKEWFDLLSKMYLHFIFYEVLTTIHRITAYHPSWIYATIVDENTNSNGNLTNGNSSASVGSSQSSPASAQSPSAKYPRLFSSLDICVLAARATIEMVRMSHACARNFFWGALFFSSTSFTTLYIRSMAKPSDPSTIYDLDLMRSLIDSYKSIEMQLDNETVTASDLISQFWETLWETAVVYVEKHSTKRLTNRRSTKTSDGGSTTPQDRAVMMNGNGTSNNLSENSHQQQASHHDMFRQMEEVGMNPLSSQMFDNQFMSYVHDMAAPDARFDYLADASMAQSLYRVSSQFYSWDADMVRYQDFSQN